MSLTRSLICASTSAIALAAAMPAHAADMYDPGSNMEWYVGVFGGGVFADREVVPVDPSISDEFGTVGGLAGLNFRQESYFFGIESDFGAIIGDANGIGFCGDHWCDMDWKAHVRGRVGMNAGMFDIFAAGGLAIADIGGDLSNRTVTGWTAGGGVEGQVTDAFRARVEVLYDEFDESDVAGTSYQGKWSDVTVRGALLFHF